MTPPLIKFILFAVLLASSAANTLGQIINRITIEDNVEFAESQYLLWIETKTLQYNKTTEDTIKKRISKQLTRNGYYNFGFNNILSEVSEDSQYVNYLISLDEGSQTYINEIYVSNIDSLDQEIVDDELENLRSSPFLMDELELSFSELLDYFENNGFPFTSIHVESTYFFYDSETQESFVDLYLKLAKNQISSIDTVVILGNTKTKDYVIKRSLRFQKGESYSQEMIEDIPAKLNRLHFFNPVEIPSYYFDSQDKGILEVTISEKETNSFDGIIGYIPSSDDNESGYITGLANISLRNLFGTGRALSFKWNKVDRFSQELELKYLEPWILGLPLNIDLLLFQRQQDSSYVQRLLNGNIEFLATESMSAALIFSQEYTIPTNPDLRGFTVYNSKSFISGVNLKIDTRDDILVPTTGLYFLNSYKYRSKNINGPAEYVPDTMNILPKQYSIELDFVFHYKLFNRNIPTVGIHFREIRGDNVEISDMYRMGGTNTLRGYRENQFDGNRLMWTNIEYRYLLGRRSYAFMFVDIGYYLKDQLSTLNLPEVSDIKIGYGLGITFETGLGLLGVSYALGEGDSFSTGKIHFGLIGEF